MKNLLRKKISDRGERAFKNDSRAGASDPSDLQEVLGRWSTLTLIGKITPEVIHDINNLLTGILGYAELLSMKPIEDEGIKKGLKTISFSAEKCKVLLGRVLALSRQESSSVRFGDVNEWIEEALELRRCALRHQQIEVIKDYSSPLPLVSVDGVHLQKALLNLIFKAEEALALREEGRRLVLKTGFEPRNQTVSITMAANGVGMDFIRLAGPLDVWSEVESTELENHFVLREAKQWIEIMGGALTLETDLAEGPVFIIRLPVKGQD